MAQISPFVLLPSSCRRSVGSDPSGCWGMTRFGGFSNRGNPGRRGFSSVMSHSTSPPTSPPSPPPPPPLPIEPSHRFSSGSAASRFAVAEQLLKAKDLALWRMEQPGRPTRRGEMEMRGGRVKQGPLFLDSLGRFEAFLFLCRCWWR